MLTGGIIVGGVVIGATVLTGGLFALGAAATGTVASMAAATLATGTASVIAPSATSLGFLAGFTLGCDAAATIGTVTMITTTTAGSIFGLGVGLKEGIEKGLKFKERSKESRGLNKCFIYKNNNPVYKITFVFGKNAGITFKIPDVTYYKKHFTFKQQESNQGRTTTLTLLAKSDKGIRQKKWKIQHITTHESDANCKVTFFGKKCYLQSTQKSIENQQNKIVSAKETIENSKKAPISQEALKKKYEQITKNMDSLLDQSSIMRMAYF